MNKTRGILFTEEMIKAILEKRKTETRRLAGLKVINENPDGWEFVHLSENQGRLFALFQNKKTCLFKTVACPYGLPGDTLHIRETFCHVNGSVVYKVDGSKLLAGGRWLTGRLMAAKYARHFLITEGVKIERLEEITREGSMREGFEDLPAFFTLFFRLNNEPKNPFVWVVKFKLLT